MKRIGGVTLATTVLLLSCGQARYPACTGGIGGGPCPARDICVLVGLNSYECHPHCQTSLSCADDEVCYLPSAQDAFCTMVQRGSLALDAPCTRLSVDRELPWVEPCAPGLTCAPTQGSTGASTCRQTCDPIGLADARLADSQCPAGQICERPYMFRIATPVCVVPCEPADTTQCSSMQNAFCFSGECGLAMRGCSSGTCAEGQTCDFEAPTPDCVDPVTWAMRHPRLPRPS